MATWHSIIKTTDPKAVPVFGPYMVAKLGNLEKNFNDKRQYLIVGIKQPRKDLRCLYNNKDHHVLSCAFGDPVLLDR